LALICTAMSFEHLKTVQSFRSIVFIFTCIVTTVPANLASAITIASDNAGNPAYADGWQAADNGGAGFGPWVFSFSGDGGGLFHAPQFIDNGPLPANSLGAPAFALTTGDRPFFTDTSEAQRTIAAPIGVGQSFSADADGSALNQAAVPFTIGNTFDFIGSDGSERFSLFTNNGYHNDNWTATGDADTGIPAGSAFHIEFTLVTANTYDLVLSPLAGGTPLFTQTGVPLAGTSGIGIDHFRITAYGTGSSTNGSKELFFDNLAITGPDSVMGDYNKNTVVDAADYVVWRDTLGQIGTSLAADGNDNGEIDAGDFDVWQSNFGATADAPGSSAAAVPEPSTWLTMAAALVGIITSRRLVAHSR
jgi:hypothetical protein